MKLQMSLLGIPKASSFTPQMFRKLCFSFSRSVIFPKPISISLSFPQYLRHSSVLSHSSLKMADATQTPDNSKIPNSSSIPSPTNPELLRSLEFQMGSCFSVNPIIPPPNQIVIVVSGPSGVGKDAVINKLREVREGLHFIVTATSRLMRPGEVDGKDYFFVSRDQFLLVVDNDKLLEYALVYGEYKGIPKKQIQEFMAKGQDIVLRVDIQGAQTRFSPSPLGGGSRGTCSLASPSSSAAATASCNCCYRSTPALHQAIQNINNNGEEEE